MRTLLIFLFSFSLLSAQSDVSFETKPNKPDPWKEARLNTAAHASYMSLEEREMVYELNRLRSNPQRYIQYLQPYLEEAEYEWRQSREQPRQAYSITTTYSTDAEGVETAREDTTWFDHYQENLDAVKDLIAVMEKLEPLTILQPHKGVYRAATKHADDQRRHGFELGHRGSDGSWPEERILKYAPDMETGNENLAGKGHGYETEVVTVREIVILLLIDSGIPGYGHRWNILNPAWTHVGTKYAGWGRSMHHWVQNFAAAQE